MSKSRARKIKLLLLDVDGVMTDGTLWFLPVHRESGLRSIREQASLKSEGGGFAISSEVFAETKGFHAHDGTAISLAHLGGLKIGLITKRISEVVALRGHDLKLDYVIQGCADKISAFRDILKNEGLSPKQACYVGDDIIDVPVMRSCGLAVAVANARREVKEEAHIVTEHRGGEGAVRDAIEYILRAQGSWKKVVDEYVAQRSAAPGKKKRR